MQCNATIYATVNPMQPHMQLATYYATACNGKMINFERKGIVPITFHINGMKQIMLTRQVNWLAYRAVYHAVNGL